MLRREVELIHIARIMAAAANDVVAKKELSANTQYAKSGRRKLKRVLRRIGKSAVDAERKWINRADPRAVFGFGTELPRSVSVLGT
jgi:hypothetical protein